jgi:hypothetical protein
MSDSAAQGEDEMQARIAALEAELASVRRAHDLQTQARERAEHEREQYRKLYSLVAFELERLKRQLFGKKAETVGPAQVQLAFGPVFDALARVEAGDASAQADLQNELQKLRDEAEPAQQQPDAERRSVPGATVGATSSSRRLRLKPSCSSHRSDCCRAASR